MTSAWDGSHGPSRAWRAGAWDLELRDDELADLRWNGSTVLRSIRAVVRDRDWNTADLVVDDVAESAGCLVLAVHSDGCGSRFDGTVRVEASADLLVIELDLVARDEYWTNRTGLVVLHPPSLTGRPLRVTHSDGAVSHTAFPADISPHQPVFNIAELGWTGDGVEVDVRFTGDVFEMEDQRNWTDASYKTYSRPLALPFPYRVGAGEHVRQRIEVRVRSAARSAMVPDADLIELVVGRSFPEIVVGASTAPDPAPHSLSPMGAAVLVEVDLATPHWRAALDRAATGGLPLDVRLVVDPDRPEALREAASVLSGLTLSRVAAFDPALHVSDAATVAALRSAMSAAGLGVPVVGGARSHFTELNREQHRLPDDLDGIVFSITPLFHSLTTEQLVESVAMQRLVAQQAVENAGGSPVHVGPVTLRPRFNNVATSGPAGAQHPDLSAGYGPELLDADDPRQGAPELAAWTVASAAALAVPGVASIAYFEEWGPRGVRDESGADRPVAAAVHTLASLRGRTLLWGSSPDGLVWAVGGASGADSLVLVANLDRRAWSVTVVVGDSARTIEVRALGASRL